MKPVNLVAQLAAVSTELACLKLALAKVKEDRDGLRQERDAWRTVAEKLNHDALGEADERRLAPPGARLMVAPKARLARNALCEGRIRRHGASCRWRRARNALARAR
jgi:hypothetical protein